MTNNTVLIYITPLLILLSTIVNANETITSGQKEQSGAVVENHFNAAHPTAWIQFIDPKSHHKMHRQFANPAFYSQFMQPGFYFQFMNPQNWMAWVNPASYQRIWDPAVMTHWINPASYLHMVDPSMYSEMMNPAAYVALVQPIVAPVQGESAN